MPSTMHRGVGVELEGAVPAHAAPVAAQPGTCGGQECQAQHLRHGHVRREPGGAGGRRGPIHGSLQGQRGGGSEATAAPSDSRSRLAGPRVGSCSEQRPARPLHPHLPRSQTLPGLAASPTPGGGSQPPRHTHPRAPAPPACSWTPVQSSRPCLPAPVLPNLPAPATLLLCLDTAPFTLCPARVFFGEAVFQKQLENM